MNYLRLRVIREDGAWIRSTNARKKVLVLTVRCIERKRSAIRLSTLKTGTVKGCLDKYYYDIQQILKKKKKNTMFDHANVSTL